MKRILLLVGLALFFVAGCGGGGGSDHRSTAVQSLDFSEIVIEPSPLSLAPLTEHQLAAYAILPDGTRQDITGEVRWESSSPAVATVGNDEEAGLVSAIEAGQAVVTAALGEVQQRVQVTVVAAGGPGGDPKDPSNPQDPQDPTDPTDPTDPADPTTPVLSIRPDENIVLLPTEKIQLRAYVLYPDGTKTEVTADERMDWSSYDSTIADFFPLRKGELWAKDYGTVEITGTFEGMTVKRTVTVSETAPPLPPEPPEVPEVPEPPVFPKP